MNILMSVPEKNSDVRQDGEKRQHLVLGESRPQMPQRGVDVVLHRTQGYSQTGAYVLVGKSVYVAQPEDLPTFRRQSGDRLVQIFPKVTVEQVAHHRITLRISTFETENGYPRVVPFPILPLEILFAQIIQGSVIDRPEKIAPHRQTACQPFPVVPE